MGIREEAIARLGKKKVKAIDERDFEQSYARQDRPGNTMDKQTMAKLSDDTKDMKYKKEMRKKKMIDKAAKKRKKDPSNIADPMYDEMHRQRARERHEMKMANKLKDAEAAKRKRAMKAAMGKQ